MDSKIWTQKSSIRERDIKTAVFRPFLGRASSEYISAAFCPGAKVYLMNEREKGGSWAIYFKMSNDRRVFYCNTFK